jgi:hypothetical protein
MRDGLVHFCVTARFAGTTSSRIYLEVEWLLGNPDIMSSWKRALAIAVQSVDEISLKVDFVRLNHAARISSYAMALGS